MLRLSGEEVDARIRTRTGGRIWMADVSKYRGLHLRQSFVDNSFGEHAAFSARVASVLYRGTGAKKYHGRRIAEHRRVWTKRKLASLASRHEDKRSFKNASPSAYQMAWRNGWLVEICARMRPLGSRMERVVYAIEHKASRRVYIGLSYDPASRFEVHRKQGKAYVQKLIRQGALLKLLTNPLCAVVASKRERLEVSRYRGAGWEVLNRSIAGTLGGSNRRWDPPKILVAAKECKTRTEFARRFPSAYKAALLLDVKIPHLRPFRKVSQQQILAAAGKCRTRTEFARSFPGPYAAAKRDGIFELACEHMPRNWRLTPKGRRSSARAHGTRPFVSIDVKTGKRRRWSNQIVCAETLHISHKNLNSALAGTRMTVGTSAGISPRRRYRFRKS